MRFTKNQTLLSLLILAISPAALAGAYPTIVAKAANGGGDFVAEGVVEAVKSSLIATQVSGRVTTLTVKAGDQVKAGQLMARVDARLEDQQILTSQAQASAAQAELAASRSEYERKQHLYEKQYISKAALERAESDFKTAEARANVTKAQTGMSKVQAGMHTITAPYAGVVAEVMTEVGSMVMPDKPLMVIYDPGQMRVVANVPQSQLASLKNMEDVQVEIPGTQTLAGHNVKILPVADAVSHTVQVRVSLPMGANAVSPGMFARVRFPVTSDTANKRIYIPLKCVVKRSELTAIYVLDRNGQPQLRQVRLGRQQGDEVEVLSGLQTGESVILDPLAAIGRP